MKKVFALTTLFVAAFGLAAGLVLTFNTPAGAIGECGEICEMEIRCTSETGPLCNWHNPNYKYNWPLCAGGPNNCEGIPIFIGCCKYEDPDPIE